MGSRKIAPGEKGRHMQSLTSYDQDLLALIIKHNFDLSAAAYERFITYQQLAWWSRLPHIAQALEQALASQATKKPPQPAEAPTSSLRYSVTSLLRYLVTSSLRHCVTSSSRCSSPVCTDGHLARQQG